MLVSERSHQTSYSLERDGSLNKQSLLTEKTFLQSLPEGERQVLLRGAKVFFNRAAKGKKPGSAPSEASSLERELWKKDALQDILQTNDAYELGEDAPPDSRGSRSEPSEPPARGLSGFSEQAAAALARAPHGSGAWALDTRDGEVARAAVAHNTATERDMLYEVARLRVQQAALRSENNALRTHTRRLVQQVCDAKQSVSDLAIEARNAQLEHATSAAEQIAYLEDQVERHKQALAELAGASEALARDNSVLATEVTALRDGKARAEGLSQQLEERMRSLQALYLEGVQQPSKVISAHEARRERLLDEVATSDVLALTRPPADFPVPAAPPKGDSTMLLKENAELRKRLGRAQDQVREAERERQRLAAAHGELSRAHVALKKQHADFEARTQSRLVGAVRRLEWLAGEDKRKKETLAERDKYITKLEMQLVQEHRATQALSRRVAQLERAQQMGKSTLGSARKDDDEGSWAAGLPQGVRSALEMSRTHARDGEPAAPGAWNSVELEDDLSEGDVENRNDAASSRLEATMLMGRPIEARAVVEAVPPRPPLPAAPARSADSQGSQAGEARAGGGPVDAMPSPSVISPGLTPVPRQAAAPASVPSMPQSQGVEGAQRAGGAGPADMEGPAESSAWAEERVGDLERKLDFLMRAAQWSSSNSPASDAVAPDELREHEMRMDELRRTQEEAQRAMRS
ncbi:unnamed protein product [Pedinophyceae sp. YPF-701]|nr:unnamed protein product [Pedinophyceae sp. YPF-701]